MSPLLWIRKNYKRRLRKLRDRLATRLFDMPFGRKLLIGGIGSRVLTLTVDCGDHIMSVSPSDYIGRKVFRKGHFERDHVDRLLAVLRERGLQRRGDVLLELGGNIGTQTIYFALSQAYRRIVTVEPDPRNVRLLSCNIQQNQLEDRVTLVNCAAGDRTGNLEFFQHHSNHGKSSAISKAGGSLKISVPVRPVAQILEEAGVAVGQVGLIWMDIEGYEPVACRSMHALMARRVPLYMEFTPAFYGREQAADFKRQLAGFYQTCIMFSEDRQIDMQVDELPVTGDQFDVLFYG
ncbi:MULTISPECIES: FkbM family methyltransferase [unclassified Rhizobium]|uniref:FkbM family methyltransferase n=1 Tax=unclassified Rhizobium TaxID=2613769 RepID=UPI001ADB0FA8|nr:MULTISPECIES: FkbM family methyltransferase [unclassified Rhizobium]MBO9097026.1 FkbM family methyltransferase [Rhizobium sp. L58/93]MBO9134122.1 FkbM family methyltransferase [Rhizobium sp. B209b/85]MBO9167264.1 FkbM family methyltransferase [Rhizobium sp. L245/93]MBO9183223.1 FkbM family methyltransferase [Rhizobium sp. E27B/91]QXZ83568.1 FkbM family methyltransferase [Rhizobium sp. K1/93]